MIKLENISKSYNKKLVLDKVNFEIKKNETTAFIGESGKGKSTLLNIIGFLDEFDQGKYFLDGKNVTNLSKKEKKNILKKRIGFIFQNFALIDDDTVYNNLKIAFPNKVTKKEETERIQSALELVNLSDKKNAKIFELSGGQQQRIAIARLFLKNCDVILADEPTGSLDEDNKKHILRLFQFLKDRNKTIIIVTHDNSIAAWCDKVYKI